MKNKKQIKEIEEPITDVCECHVKIGSLEISTAIKEPLESSGDVVDLIKCILEDDVIKEYIDLHKKQTQATGDLNIG